MWDPFNNTLVAANFDSSSPNVSFGVAPMYGTNALVPPLPYSLARGIGTGLPYDMYSFSNHSNNLPLKAHKKSFWEQIPKTIKVIGELFFAGMAIVGAVKGYKALKGLNEVSKMKPKTKTSFLETLKGWLPNSEKRRFKNISKKLAAKKFEGFDQNDLKILGNNLKGANKQTINKIKNKIKIMSQEGFNQWKTRGFTTV
jgi:hypothetical protein